MTKGILSGYGFDGQEKYLVLDHIDDSISQRSKTVISDKYIDLSVNTEKKTCTGSYDLLSGSSIPCLQRRIIEKKYDTCFDCRKKSGFNPAFYNVDKSSLSPQQSLYNEQSHIVYLAHFWDDVIKVWIAHKGRWRTRLLEQGARSATILWEFEDAYKARILEADISRLGIAKERITSTMKSKLIFTHYDNQNARNVIQETIQSINHCLGKKFPTDIDMITFDDVYFSSDFQNQIRSGGKLPKPVKLGNNEHIEWSVVGLCGDSVILNNNISHSIIFLKNYFWYLIDVTLSNPDEVTDIESKVPHNTQFLLF